MGSVDWTGLSGILDAASVARDVTSSPSPPPGGGSFIYGFDSKVDTKGAVAWTLDAGNNPDHAPAAKGASIRGAIKRGVSALKTGFSPFFFASLQGGTPAVTDNAYILGLENSDPYRIVVVKGQIINGVPAASPQNSLLRSTATYTIDSDPDENWKHVRMDVIVQGNGDVLIRVYENDLDTNDVDAPEWALVAGMELFTDDVLGVNSGSLPFVAGYMGFGFASEAIGRRSYFDYLEMLRQV